MGEKIKPKMEELLEKYGTKGISLMLKSLNARLDETHKEIVVEMAELLEEVLEEEMVERRNG